MSTRQLGFKLVTIGNDKTLSELDKVNKKMDELSSKIKAIQKTPIKLSTAFDTKGLNDLLKTLEKVDKTKLNPQILNTIKELRTQLNQLEKQVLTTQTKLDKVSIPELTDVQVNKINGSFAKLNGNAAKVMETIAKLRPGIANIDDESIRKTYDSLAKVEARLKTIKEERKVVLSTKGTSEVETATLLDPLIKEQKALIDQKKLLEQQSKKTAKALFDENRQLPTDSIVALRLELNKLSKEYYELSQAQRESSQGQALQSRINELTNTVSSSEQSIGNFRRNVGNYQSALSGLLPKLEELERQGISAAKGLDSIFKEDLIRREQDLRAEISKLGDELNELGTDISKASDRAAKFSQLDDKIREFTGVRTQLDSMGNSFDRLGGKFLKVSDIITGGLIGGGIIGLVTGITQGVKQTVALNTALADVEADVRKTTGLTADEVKSLTEAFKEIDTRTTTQELLKIAAVAGQLGVTGTDGVKEFTKSVDVLNVALGDELPGGAEEIATTISKLSNVLYGATTNGELMAERMLFIGNTLNVLSASGAATSENIVEFSRRIGQSLTPLGVTAEQILALSATFDELAINPEKGATAINNLIKDIGANTKLFADTLQINQDELRKAFNTDPLEAFDIVLKRINQLSGGDNTKALNLLKDLRQTGDGVSGVFLQLSKNTELYAKNLGLSSKAILETSSIFSEFKVKNENLAGVFDKISKKIQDFATDPAIVAFVERLGNILTGLVSLLSKTFNGITSFYDRLSLKTQQSSDIIKGSFGEVSSSALFMSKAQFTMHKNISLAISTIEKEQAALITSFKVLNDDNASRSAKNKIIDELLQKYPGLLTKYELEGASTKELAKLQTDLTKTLKKEVFERIKIKATEEIETQKINLLLRKTELDLGRGFTDSQIKLAESLGQKANLFAREKKRVDKELDEINKIQENQLAVFEEFQKRHQIDLSESFGNLDYGKVRSNLAGLIESIEDVIDSSNIDKKTKAILDSINKQADGLLKTVKIDSTTDQLDTAFKQTIKLQNEYEKAINSTGVELTKNNDLKDLGADKDKKAAKATKDIADQLERIEQLRRRIIDLNLDAITNEFSRNIAEVKEETRRSIEDIQKDINSLEIKKIKTNADELEINIAKELIRTLQDAEDAAIIKIENERNEALKKAARELDNAQKEILKNIAEINKTEIELQITQADFDLSQQTRKINIEFQSNVDDYKKQLADGLITQKEFDELVEQNEIDKLDAIAKLYENFTKGYIDQLNIRYKAELDFAEKTKDNAKSKALTDLTEANKQVELDFLEGNLTFNQAFEARIKNHLEYNNAIKKIDQDNEKEKQDLNNRLVEDTQRVNDLALESHRALEDGKTNKTDKASKEREAIEKARLELIKNESIALAEDISSTLFAIEQDRIDRLFDSQKSRTERNYDNQIKLAQGNKQEIARIEAEKAAKIEELERQQAKARKNTAIKEAIIAGALAVIKALPNFLLIPFIVAATALQVARIKSQSFAKGGKVKSYGGFTGGSIAPPDETGERPVDAQLHEGEYVNTRKQVNKHPWLYELLEADRKRTNAGASTNLEQHIADKIQARRQVVFNLQKENQIKRFEPIIPVVIPFGTTGKQKIEFSEEHLEFMAEILSDRIAAKSGQAIYTGTTEGIKTASKETQRFERTQKRKLA